MTPTTITHRQISFISMVDYFNVVSPNSISFIDSIEKSIFFLSQNCTILLSK
ncbi:hypothetical protein MtrunA17_Chr1g0157831 [Medicago truncatula]|uniref:Uncharacterized protein n=1 Tax=Medicago truncatula TaxID=3880 RepID=A0A396JN84_MEDTR|nr:hypothetical protein MtrunA17_Chr1g0157831 [Medicago truncatula]